MYIFELIISQKQEEKKRIHHLLESDEFVMEFIPNKRDKLIYLKHFIYRFRKNRKFLV